MELVLRRTQASKLLELLDEVQFTQTDSRSTELQPLLEERFARFDLSSIHQKRIRITKDKVRRVLACEANFEANLRHPNPPTWQMLAGSILDTLFTQFAVGQEIELPYDEALAALVEGGDSVSSVESLHGLDAANRELVVRKVDEVANSMQRQWPRTRSLAQFRLKFQDRIAIPMANGRLELHGRPDLIALFRTTADGSNPEGDTQPEQRSSKGRTHSAILDAKSGVEHVEDAEDAAFYAALEAMRSGSLPALTGSYYLASGEITTLVPTEELMMNELDRIENAVSKILRLTLGGIAVPSKCSYCSYCPIRATCPEYEPDSAGSHSELGGDGLE